MTGWTVYRERIPEIVVPGKPLGRHIHFDSRSLAYPWVRRGAAPMTRLWARSIPILDQGQVGSCTGNAEIGACGCEPLFPPLDAQLRAQLNEQGALALYSAAETIDGDGPYPPQDNGSSGTSVATAAKNAGFISGFLHVTNVTDMTDALQEGPVIVGVNWYDSFDTPDKTGLVTIPAGAAVRGGHEFLVRGLDVTAQLFDADNSWGTDWGVSGSFRFSWDTMARLFSEQGDCVAPVALSQPAPVPVPAPEPAPVVAPSDANPDDVALAKAMQHWSGEFHLGQDKSVATAARVWLTAKGFL